MRKPCFIGDLQYRSSFEGEPISHFRKKTKLSIEQTRRVSSGMLFAHQPTRRC
jgi:hypothetical protein